MSDSGKPSGLQEKIMGAMRRRGKAIDSLERLRRLSGGAMQETWAFDARIGDRCEPLILRLAPGNNHEVREGTISLPDQAGIIALAHELGIPSPRVEILLNEQDDLGAGFLMNFITGETLPRRILRDPDYDRVRPHLARQCGEILAQIHAMPLDRLPAIRRETPAAMVAGLRVMYDRLNSPRPVLELAFQWLRHNMVEPSEPAIVHADFRNGNLIVNREGIAAVLDWERAFIGDPMYDLGWLTIGSWRFGEISKPVGGFGDMRALIEGYRSVGNRDVDGARVRFWRVYGSLDWGIGTLDFSKKAMSTNRALEHAAIGRRSSEAEIDLLRLIAGEEENLDDY